MSLPSRERGLKLYHYIPSLWFISVAPFAGAWIEISKWNTPFLLIFKSLPSRERGLKFIWTGRDYPIR